MPNYSKAFPWLIPSTYAMALWVTTPALALIILTIKNRLSQVMIVTFIMVLSLDLVHGVIGFSQFGYRFALDGILFLIIALIPALKARYNLAYVLIALSILINFYVVLEFALGYFGP